MRVPSMCSTERFGGVGCLVRPTPRGFANLINPFAPLPEGRRAADMYDMAWLGDRPLPRLFDPEKTMEPEGIRIK